MAFYLPSALSVFRRCFCENLIAGWVGVSNCPPSSFCRFTLITHVVVRSLPPPGRRANTRPRTGSDLRGKRCQPSSDPTKSVHVPANGEDGRGSSPGRFNCFLALTHPYQRTSLMSYYLFRPRCEESSCCLACSLSRLSGWTPQPIA
jgi:hypothetical protein